MYVGVYERDYEEWFPMNVRAVYRYEKKAAAESAE